MSDLIFSSLPSPYTNRKRGRTTSPEKLTPWPAAAPLLTAPNCSRRSLYHYQAGAATLYFVLIKSAF
jgi:hypothetical protein